MPRSLVIIGPPGTGKTTAGVDLARDWLKDRVGPSGVAYLAFTKAAAKEAASRILDKELREAYGDKLPYFRTIHSLAYRGLRKAKDDIRVVTERDMKQFAKWSGLEGRYAVSDWEDLSEAYQRLAGGGGTDWDQCLNAYTISRISARTPGELELAKTRMSRTALKMLSGFIGEDVYQAFVAQYETYKRANNLVDFTDMLAYALTEMPPLDEVRYVIVDEAQDCARILHSVVDRLFQNAEEIWFIGDVNQCQPAGTMVTLHDGRRKPIEALVQGDRLLSFDRRGACFTGRPMGHGRGGASVVRTGMRLYSGPLFEMKAAGRTTRFTLEHKFIVKWLRKARFGKACVIYIMQRGNRFRVGWCQLFNVMGLLHLRAQARIEKAERAWILRVYRNRTEASVAESVVSCKYGIPTATFEPVNGATHLTRKAIDAIFNGVGDRKEAARRCLEDHGRSLDFPFYDIEKYRFCKRTTIMEAEACNLLPGLMTVPVDEGDKTPSWVPFTLETRQVNGLPVFSVELDRNHTYMADGIGTHNCIYNFAAADAKLFLQRIHEADHRLALRQTHRFGQAIVDFSARIISRAKDRFLVDIIGVPDRKHEIKVTGSFSPVVEPMFILHRHVMGCQAIARAYIDEGKPFRNERGRDPLGAENRVLAFKTFLSLADGKEVSAGAVGRLVDDFMPSLLQPQMGTQGKSVRLVVHGAKKRLQEGLVKGELDLKNLVTAKILTQEGADVVRQRAYRVLKHPEDLEYYHRVVQNDYSLDGTEIPVITTIHGSKGRQAPRVVVFDEMSGKCWNDEDAEHRLAYVAATRTRGDVEICAERTVSWAYERYDYPVGDDGQEEKGLEGDDGF